MKYRKGKRVISSSNIQIEYAKTWKRWGALSTEKTKYKVESNGNINNIFYKLQKNFNISNEVKKNDINTNYNIDYRVYEKNNKTHTYGVISLSDFLASNNSADVTFNTKQIRINFFDNYYQSSNSEIFLNNTKFMFSLDTDISDKQIKYIANSSGLLSDLFMKKFVKHKLINSFTGESEANIEVVYELKNNKISMKLVSSLEGMAFNIISPFNKSSDETQNFQLSYDIEKKRKKRIKIKYESYDIELSKAKSNLDAMVNSPYLSGTLMLPDKISSDDRLTARLKYFDLKLNQ